MPKSNLSRSGQPPKSLVRYEIDSLTQGVSQQPQHLRQVGQGTEQINGWSSVVNGLTKRRPGKFVGKILPNKIDDFYIETMPVTDSERYTALVYPVGTDKMNLQIRRGGVPPTIDVHGTGLSTVTANGATEVQGTKSSYLWTDSDRRGGYVLINNGSLGLLLNRTKVTAMENLTTGSTKKEALIFVQGVNYDVKYTVILNGTEAATYTTPKATADNNQISTDEVAERLKKQIDDLGGWTAQRSGSVVHLKLDDDSNFSIQVDDSRSNTLARAIKDTVTNFSELPTVATKDFTVKVEENASSTLDDVWVKFVPRDTSVTFGEGTWQEIAAPNIKYKIEEDTMPLVIYRAAQDVIFVGPADGATRTAGGQTYTFPKWGERSAGDETTVPEPSFIGFPLHDHVLFRSRYWVIGGEYVVGSEVDDIFNFFNKQASQVLETDPIDVRATSESGIDLNWLLPVDESILVFSAKSQFRLQAADADVLTPRTAVILRLSNIEMNKHLRPKISGPNAVFATEEYGFTGFREYQFIDTQQRRIGLNLGGGQNISLNVPKYIEGLTKEWDVGETLDFFATTTGTNKKHLFIYKYLWQNTTGAIQKQQSSWSRWQFDGDIEWIRVFDNKLWLVLGYADGMFLQTIEMEELTSATDPEILLDRQIRFPECNSTPQTTDNITATYDSDTDKTTFTLPYTMVSTTDAVVRYDETSNQGLVLGTASSGTDIVCERKGDWRTTKIVFGARYNFEYTFTNAYVPTKDQARSRYIGELDGRLQVATWTINHYHTGRYEVVVSRKNRKEDSKHTFRARAINVMNNKTDTEESVLATGHFRVPVYSRNTDCTIKVQSDSWLPLTLSSACWEGNYSNRAKSVG